MFISPAFVKFISFRREQRNPTFNFFFTCRCPQSSPGPFRPPARATVARAPDKERERVAFPFSSKFAPKFAPPLVRRRFRSSASPVGVASVAAAVVHAAVGRHSVVGHADAEPHEQRDDGDVEPLDFRRQIGTFSSRTRRGVEGKSEFETPRAVF